MPEALQYYQRGDRVVELLPSPQSLDSPTARSERELLKRIQVINQFVEQQNGERAVAEALAYKLRLNLLTIVNERQQLKVGYGQYAALRVLRIWVGDPLGISWPSINRAAPGRLSLKITPVDSMN